MTQNVNAQTYAISVGATSVSQTISATDIGIAYMEIENTGATNVFVMTSTGASTAVIPTGAGLPGTMVGPGDTKLVLKDPKHDTITAIGSGAGPSLVYFKLGGNTI